MHDREGGSLCFLRDLVGCRRWPHLRPGLGEPVTLRLVHPKSHLFSTIRGYHPREPSKSHPLPDLCFLQRLPTLSALQTDIDWLICHQKQQHKKNRPTTTTTANKPYCTEQLHTNYAWAHCTRIFEMLASCSLGVLI